MFRSGYARLSRVFLVLLMALCAIDASAQSQSSSLTGWITDESGAALADVDVQVHNVATGVTRSVQSAADGSYQVPLLPPGEYRLRVQKAGFRAEERTAVALAADSTRQVDFRLVVGAVADAVEVTASRVTIETQTTAQSTVIDTQRITDMPLLGRNPQALMRLVPGVRPMSATNGLLVSAYGDSAASIAGGSPSVNNIMIDGAAAENHTSGMMQSPLSPDAMEEFRIMTHNAPAEYGRTGGGIINIISKSGTNRYSGAGWEFFRSRELNANDYFSKRNGTRAAPFKVNQYGATAGGPIVRQRTFFFFNWEGARQNTVARSIMTVPTALQRRGDFSQTFDASGRLQAIYDPLTTRPDPNNPGRYIRDPFPGNVIPANRLNPVALAMAGYYPLPNLPGAPVTGVSNYQGEGWNRVKKDLVGLRVDHYLTPSRRLFARYTTDGTSNISADFIGGPAEPSIDRNYPRRSMVLNYSDAPRPNLLVEARVGLNQFMIEDTQTWDFDQTQVGFPSSLNNLLEIRAFPSLSVSDVTTIGANSNPAAQTNSSWTAAGSATWLAGGHTVKSGAELRVYQWKSIQGDGTFNFSFSPSFTNGPDPSSASQSSAGFASFMLGYPSGGGISQYPLVKYSTKNVGLFVQDDWKVNARLTMNLGFRWEYESPTTELNDKITNFDPNAVTTAGGVTLRGGLIFPGTDGLPRGNRDTSWTDLGPRAGAAYQLRPGTVLRGSYGLFYLPTTGVFIRLARTGYTSQTTYVASVDGGLTPSASLTNPYPQGLTPSVGSSLGLLTGLGTNVAGDLRSLRRGTSQQWGADIQQQLSDDWVVVLGYMGNRSRHLPATRVYRYLPEDELARGTALQQLVPNPYAGLISTGALAAAQVPLGTLLMNYPQFTAASGLDNWAASNYHAATVRLERRMRHGLSMLVSYTYSRLRDNNLGSGSNGGDFVVSGSNSVQNWDNLDAEWAVSTSDQPQRLVISGSYQLPFGQSGSRLYRALAGGWQVNAVAELVSGNVIAVTANAPAYGGGRPNLTGERIAVDNPSVDRWLNRDAFANIPAFTYGNAPRNLSDVRTQPLKNVDFSVFKNFNFGTRRLQARVEAFNLFNGTTLGNPVANINSAAFGTITSLRPGTAPRQVQLGLKFYF